MARTRHTLAGLATAVLCATITLLAAPTPAVAADYDINLSRFADFDRPNNNPCAPQVCGEADPNNALFNDLVRDFGQVMAPALAAPSKTLGQAGFAVQLIPGMSIIPADERHWQLAVQQNSFPRNSDGSLPQDPTNAEPGPGPVLFTPQVMIRKGLPFSFEIAGTFSHIAKSSMFTVGGQLKWALFEGFEKWPNIAVRGTVNTLVGSRDLQMVTAGGDVSISKSFAIGSTFAMTTYGGYQNLNVFGWSRLLTTRPQDPRPPQEINGETYNPLFAFEPRHRMIHRGFGGIRFDFWAFDLLGEAVIGEGIYQVNLSAGLNF